VDLSIKLGPLQLRNPILSASGTFGHGLEMQHFVAPELLGGLVSKTVTPDPRPGNPAPRIRETEAGFLNSIGLENRGVQAYIDNVLPTLVDVPTVIMTNVGSETRDGFAEMVECLDGFDQIGAFELNLSCPNVDGGRLPFSTEPAVAEGILRNARARTKKPLFAKLSPNVTRIADMARAVEAGGADGITAINTLLGMQVDWRTGAPGLATVVGGYSGVGIKPVALRCAWECVRAVDIPVIGCGGISTAEDVLEFLAVGCRAVQVGTACFSDPGLLEHLAGEIETLLLQEGASSPEEVVGRLQVAPALA
jgi:dihydroorotate dehydrogenase (NAD+) catalytic subunit